MNYASIGEEIYSFAERLWPYNRSLTGNGVRETISEIRSLLEGLKTYEVPTGTKAFDWIVPQEWRVRDAYLVTPAGEKICDFSKNNLHLVGYSVPFNGRIALEELQFHLHSLPSQPEAIPYITSYYEKQWGFCISHTQRESLPAGTYQVVIDTELFDGSMTYADLFITGESKSEVLLSTYICHPSLANNELSGPCVTTYLARWLLSLENRRYSYRVVFIPETIGSIFYIHKHLHHLKSHVVAGFNITCVGDDRAYSFLPSRSGSTLSDRTAQHVLHWIDPGYKRYSWADRGSDERQWCAPHVDLPISSIMRTKYGSYKEYHTSLDNLVNVVNARGLEGGFSAIQATIQAIENNKYPISKTICEPQLGRRGLYPTLMSPGDYNKIRVMNDFLSMADGRHDMIQIADFCRVPIWELYPLVTNLERKGLISLSEVAVV